jgi:hypothetical protein
MTAAIVAAVAATLGIILGRFWDMRSETMRVIENRTDRT